MDRWTAGQMDRWTDAARGQKDRHHKIKSRLSQFCERAWKQALETKPGNWHGRSAKTLSRVPAKQQIQCIGFEHRRCTDESITNCVLFVHLVLRAYGGVNANHHLFTMTPAT